MRFTAAGEIDPVELAVFVAECALHARAARMASAGSVIEAHHQQAPRNPSLGQLYGQAAELLGLRADAIEGDTAASKAAKQVLQGLMNIAVGMGELRTRIGRGHGRASASPARQRHAELATNAAGTLALFMLDTWTDPSRPSSTREQAEPSPDR